MTDTFVPIYIRLESIAPDPVQYKPYNPRLEPMVTQPIYVKVMVPAESVVDGQGYPPEDGIILTPKGLAIICAEVAGGIRDRYESTY